MKEEPAHKGDGGGGGREQEKSLEREDMVNSVMLHGGHIQGPKHVAMGDHQLPE